MKKGFTLIELMIALAVFSIFGGFVYKTYYSQVKVSKAFNKSIDLEYNTSKVMKKVTEKIREENKIITLTKEEDSLKKVVKFIYNDKVLVEVSDKYDISVNISNTAVKSIDDFGLEDEESDVNLIYINVIGTLKEDDTDKVILNSTINISK